MQNLGKCKDNVVASSFRWSLLECFECFLPSFVVTCAVWLFMRCAFNGPSCLLVVYV